MYTYEYPLFKGVEKELKTIQDIVRKHGGSVQLYNQESEIILNYVLKTYSNMNFFKIIEDVFGPFPTTMQEFLEDNCGDKAMAFMAFQDYTMREATLNLYNLDIQSYKRLNKDTEEVLGYLLNPLMPPCAIYEVEYKEDSYNKNQILCIYQTGDENYGPNWQIRTLCKHHCTQLLEDHKNKVNSLIF